MDDNGIIIWAAFLTVFLFGILYYRRVTKQIDERGVEVVGTISRVTESTDSEDGTITTFVHAKYRQEAKAAEQAGQKGPAPHTEACKQHRPGRGIHGSPQEGGGDRQSGDSKRGL